ncbi:ParA family protein [uncultured Umboniibacter sp.]|uniref:ParA family protein n=1 Tax=uncultured Umboniibacter sp. TaxID=1798917 RepID=UPI0026088CC2|nr:ParA family protein [uncultured Umboniibacter sp.]
MRLNLKELCGKWQGAVSVGQKLFSALRERNERLAPTRHYTGKALEKALGVSPATISRLAKEHPEVFSSLGATRRYADPNQLNEIRRLLKKEESNSKTLVGSVSNYKGGVHKSTLTYNLGAYLAHKGYKVLLIDMDAQGTLSLLSGLMPDVDTSVEDSLTDLLDTRSDALIVEEDLEGELLNRIKSTHLDNMDIIPAAMSLSKLETFLSVEKFMCANGTLDYPATHVLFKLRYLISKIDGYDFVLLDGTPSVGTLNQNIFWASDFQIVPTPCIGTDLASTVQYLALLGEALDEELEVTPGLEYEMGPSQCHVPVKYNNKPNDNCEMYRQAITTMFAENCMHTPIVEHERVIQAASTARRSIFDFNRTNDALLNYALNPNQLKKAVENYEEVFEEVLHKVVYPLLPEKREYLIQAGFGEYLTGTEGVV